MVSSREIKFMTYNVWAREDAAVYRRMKAIGDLVRKHKPDVIFFQEVTSHIYRIFASFDWWKEPYHDMRSCNCLLTAMEVPRCGTKGGALLHEGPGLPRERHGADPPRHRAARGPRPAGGALHRRSSQAYQVVEALGGRDNAVMGWDDDVDRPFPLMRGWLDAWKAARADADRESSWTYDAVWNAENVGVCNGYAPPRSSLKRR
ncbi:hypothetical protein BAE44_0009299 [Dichanthelium oligosanthes]|uniref:Endonuclease/exonuclease/phosphatase domain-containing protein n=1 Tax=Dichanthelium oligosanthes TaxID=888268 RepID=A0A1E5VX61_9POAL|nr:hypothetical protein BAE44_0009299 [Dichanthelium oligosanthes]